jgi:hypothetical protein
MYGKFIISIDAGGTESQYILFIMFILFNMKISYTSCNNGLNIGKKYICIAYYLFLELEFQFSCKK